jgi:hypothetical protein
MESIALLKWIIWKKRWFFHSLTFSGLAKVGFRKYQSSNLVQKFIESTNVQPSTEPPLLPNPCYAFVVLFGRGLFVCFYCCLGAVA